MDDADRWVVETAILAFYGLIAAVAGVIVVASLTRSRCRG